MVYAFSIHIRDRRGRAVPIFHRLFMELDEGSAACDETGQLLDTGDDLFSASFVDSTWTQKQIMENMTEDGETASLETQSVRSLESDMLSSVSTLQISSESGVNLPSAASRFIAPVRSPALLGLIDEVQSQCNYNLAVNVRRPKRAPGQTSTQPLQQAVSTSESAAIAAAESLDFGVYSTVLQGLSGQETSVRATWLFGFNLCFLLVCDEEENPLAAKAMLKLISQKCQEHLRLFNKPLSAIYRAECLHYIVKTILGDGILRFLNNKALKMLEKEMEKGIRQFAKP